MNYEKIEQGYENLIDFALSNQFSKYLDAAKAMFVLSEDKTDIEGFTEWFIFTHTVEGQTDTIVDAFDAKMNDPVSQALKNSIRSVYSIHKDGETLVLTDILTNDHYVIKHAFYSDEGLYSFRIAQFEDEYFIVGDVFEFDKTHDGIIRKYIFEQYNTYCSVNGNISMDQFIKEQNHLILKISNIITEVYQDNESEDEYVLYQSSYAFKMKSDELVDLLLEVKEYDLYADEDDEQVFRWFHEDELIAELEVEGNILNVLCANENASKLMVAIFSELTNEDFVFIKSEILTIDEII